MRLAAEGAIVTVVIISRAPLTHVCMLMQTRGGCFSYLRSCYKEFGL